MTRRSAAATAAEAPYAGATYWDALAPDMHEATFQGHVVREALELGYLVYFTQRSTGSPKGFPDLVLCRPRHLSQDGYRVTEVRLAGRIVYLELKTERGKLTPEQRVWRDALLSAGAECYSPVKPRDFARIVAVLAATGRPE